MAVQGRLATALQLIAGSEDGQEKAVAYWQVVQALLKIAKYDDALSVVRLISEDSKENDRCLDTLLQIFRAQWEGVDRRAASATLSEALSLVEREPEISPGSRKPLPAILVYSHRPGMLRSIAHSLVLVGNKDVARTIVARISAMASQEQDPEKRKGILGPLAAAQADVGDFAAARRTIAPIRSDFFARIFFEEIASERARQGDITGALATLSSMPKGFGLPDLQEISRTLSDAGDYNGARTVVEKMRDPGERAYGLADLAFQQADKDPAGAKLNVTLAWKLTQEARGKAPSYIFQNAVEFVAATRARLRDFAGALEIINGPDLQRK